MTFNREAAVAYASRLNCRCSSLLRRSGRQAADLRGGGRAQGELNEDFKLWVAIKMARRCKRGRGSLSSCSCSACSNVRADRHSSPPQ